MSTLVATISHIESIENLNIIEFIFEKTTLKMVSLDLNNNIKVGKQVILTIKPSSIAVAKIDFIDDFSKLVSYSNQIKSKIVSIEKGKLLCSIKLTINDSFLESIITLEALNRLNLRKNDEVIAFIKANEISILEIIDD